MNEGLIGFLVFWVCSGVFIAVVSELAVELQWSGLPHAGYDLDWLFCFLAIVAMSAIIGPGAIGPALESWKSTRKIAAHCREISAAIDNLEKLKW